MLSSQSATTVGVGVGVSEKVLMMRPIPMSKNSTGGKCAEGECIGRLARYFTGGPNPTQLLCIDPDFVQGQELYEDSVSARGVGMVVDPASNTDRKSSLSLYSCSFTSPPERVEHYSVQH